jgi:protein-disulfide reductase (glutathione)
LNQHHHFGCINWLHSQTPIVMLAKTLLVLALSFVAATAAESESWGDSIKWMKPALGRKVAKQTGRPMFFLVHKHWCGACKALRPKFAASEEIAELSKSFIMVDAGNDDEPSDAQFAPDGGYVPRILFADSMGNVDASIVNTDRGDKYKFFYPDPAAIVRSMKAMLDAHTKDEL